MNIVTVVSPEFLNDAKYLITSFRKFYPNDKIILCYFGGDITGNIQLAKEVYFIEVPHLCAHAHNPRFYFFKTYALKAAMSFNEPFLYLDSRHKLLNKPVEIEKSLKEKDRFFVQYPHEEVYKLKVCTTSKCFKEMGCDVKRYKESHYYWAAIQAYNPTDFNKKFIEEMLEFMMNPDVAGPSNFIKNPEPDNLTCLYHRNDQSCLSILIEKYNIHQAFDMDISQKYGDIDTLEILKSKYQHDKNMLVIKGRNSNVDSNLQEAEQEIQNGNRGFARAILAKILQNNPNNFDALNNLAVIEISEKNYSEAVGLLKQILELNPTNEIALGNLAYLQNHFQSIAIKN